MITVMHVVKAYRGNYPLLNNIVKNQSIDTKTIVCYLTGKDDGNNKINEFVDNAYYLAANNLHLYNLSIPIKLKKIIEKEGVEIVCCHLEKVIYFGVLSLFFVRNKIKIVGVIHGLVGKNENPIFRKIKNLIFFKKLNAIIAVSKSIREDVLRNNYRIPESKVYAVQNGLVYDEFLADMPKREARESVLPQCDSSLWFGTVGRLAEKKNHKNLIMAFNGFLEKFPDSSLLIVGGGELESTLKDMVKSFGIEEKVFFLGIRKDIPQILKTLDVFVFPTYREGLPLSLLEAMASEIPVIGSNIGCIREVFEDSDMGVLIDPNSIESIENAMEYMAALPEETRRLLGANARIRALNSFTAGKMALEYQNIFEKVYREDC